MKIDDGSNFYSVLSGVAASDAVTLAVPDAEKTPKRNVLMKREMKAIAKMRWNYVAYENSIQIVF